VVDTPHGVLTTESDLVFVGKVTRIGPLPGRDSGNVDAYQLVKYRIQHLCRGSYEGREIVVDHLLLRSDDLKDLRVGEVLCVAVTKSKSISLRYNADGIRAPSDVIDTFYIGGLARPARKQQPCSCGV
jgi:hypothetical protein